MLLREPISHVLHAESGWECSLVSLGENDQRISEKNLENKLLYFLSESIIFGCSKISRAFPGTFSVFRHDFGEVQKT